MKQFATKDVVVAGLALALLGGAAADRLSLRPPTDAGPYHERVREAVKLLPKRIGDWMGREIEQPTAAVRLLRPNVILCREYQNYVTLRRATFLVVQCSDARDLVGHYPPVCYPNQGWRVMSKEPGDWDVDGTVVRGTIYQFRQPGGAMQTTVVRNFMVLPDGRFERDMDAVDAASQNVERRFYGAAQVQVIVDASVPAEERDEIFGTLVAGNWPVIEAIRSGVK